MRLGLIGGTFDPLHMGHLQMARIALKEASLDKVYFLPSARSPQKRHNPAPAAQRISWIKKSILGQKGLDVLDMDLRKGPIYTADTVRLLKERFQSAEFVWILGADQLENLRNWRDADFLIRSLSFFAFKRGELPLTRLKRPDFRLRFARQSILTVSSSRIRELLKRGESISGLVPKAIEEELPGFYRRAI
jgi:nicotinate-nucleotide adenylyltransferase